MKRADDLNERINEIGKKISRLQNQQEKLYDEIRFRDDIPFHLKFKIWSVCTKNRLHLCYDCKELPNTTVLLEREGIIVDVPCSKRKFGCENQIDIIEKLNQKFHDVFNGLIENLEEQKLIENAMKELMDNNICFLTCKNKK